MNRTSDIATERNATTGLHQSDGVRLDGWRGRIGFIVPASNGVVEYEIARMLPDGISAHYARAPHHPDRTVRLGMMVDAIPQLARDLASANVDAVCFACTTGSFSVADYEIRALEAIRQAGCKRQGTTATAVLEAIGVLFARRLSVVSPYPDDYNERLRSYFEARGVHVTRLASLYSEEPESIAPEQLRDFCLANADPSADAVFISCTKLRTLEVIADIEDRMGVPAISSIGASLWQLVGDLDLPASPLRPGRLFDIRTAPRGPARGSAYQENNETKQRWTS